mmetsp:Transcript_91455/g.284401  ORF Transcript_91455/g.284401 Transcript_91455/m.284401 type:complete len:241 (-) Transcript_91455:71-793(-)
MLLRSLAQHREQEVPRGPGVVRLLAHHLRHRGLGDDEVDVVGAPLRLELGEPVGDLDPGVAAEVLVPVHADDVGPALAVEVDHGLDAAEAGAHNEDGVLVLLRLVVETLDAPDEDATGALLRRLHHPAARGELPLDGQLLGVQLQEAGQHVLDLLDGGAHLGAYGHALVAALEVDLDRAVGEALLAPCQALVVELLDVLGDLHALVRGLVVLPEGVGRVRLGRQPDAHVRRLGDQRHRGK